MAHKMQIYPKKEREKPLVFTEQQFKILFESFEIKDHIYISEDLEQDVELLLCEYQRGSVLTYCCFAHNVMHSSLHFHSIF